MSDTPIDPVGRAHDEFRELTAKAKREGKTILEIRTKAEWDAAVDRMALHLPVSRRNGYIRHMERAWFDEGPEPVVEPGSTGGAE